MPEKIEIKISRADALELISIISVLDFTDEHAPRFQRLKDSLMTQLCEQSTLEDLDKTIMDVNGKLDSFHFPEIIE